MKRKDQLKDNLIVDYLLQHDPGLVEKLLDNPKGVLERLKIDEAALKCTDEAHKAFERGESFSNEIKTLGDISLVDALPEAKKIAHRIFGQNIVVEKIPFGLRFSERIRDISVDWTATGSGTITFGGLDGDTDIDG